MALAGRQDIIVVGIGDCRIASAPALAISTYALGSCIAVVAWDWKLKLGGLLHIMLPDSSIDPAKAVSNPHVYADTGVPSMFQSLIGKGSSKKQLRWCLVGGANMMVDSSHFEIGKRNHIALKKVLWKLGVFIDQEDVGGTESRSVRLDLESGRTDVRTGVGREQILMPAAVSFMMRKTDDANTTR